MRGDFDLLQQLVVVGVLVVSVYSREPRYCNPLDSHSPHTSGKCGSQLSETLSLVCQFYGGFYSNDYLKRSGVKDYKHHTNKANRLSHHLLGDRSVSRPSAFSFLENKKRSYGTGVVCECCYNQCMMSEMRQYCAFGEPYYDEYSMFIKRNFREDSPGDAIE